ncbi:MAG: two pore domain potassium channel family protein [Deltaproteobacteria bacterium]|nr:two pore domain potassium channel family protein [Deltaproteobacteria bacterium]
MNKLRFRLRILLFLLAAVMLAGSIGFMITENLSLTDAVYFSIVTIATVGYGDIYPATAAGKIFAVILIVTGVGTFLGVIANATDIMLNKREEAARFQKLNMVIGLFFSEVGSRLLSWFSDSDPHMASMRNDLIVSSDWSENSFQRVSALLATYQYKVDLKKIDLVELRDLLNGKGDLLLRLLENPILVEHESFTDLLRAVFHLKEELSNRKSFRHLPETDLNHLAGDVQRVYVLLSQQWIQYMKYLKVNYPYLFSLAVRTNPFHQEASPIVTE